MTADVNKAGDADNLESELESLPEKFKGKTAIDIAKSYENLEAALSRQGNELAEYKRLAHTLAETGVRTSAEPPKERKPVTTEALLEDPDKAIEAAIESHPAVVRARETADNLERQIAQRSFESAHPSFREDVKDANFTEWVKKNPALLKLAVAADSYDMDAADQLWSLWEEKKGMQAESKEKVKQELDKKQRERAGTLEGASGADASSETVYNRADIRELKRRAMLGDRAAIAKVNDPKWKANILKAYQDKRVS